MDIHTTHRYDAPPDAVFATLTDPDLVKAKYEALGHSDVEILSVEHRDDGGVTMTSRRVVPMDVPGFAKKVLSPKNTVVQTDAWGPPGADGVRRGTWSVEAKGVPVTLGGTLRLAADGEGSTNTIDGKVECKIPLVGGKIASFVGGDATKAIAHEEAYTRQVLAGG